MAFVSRLLGRREPLATPGQHLQQSELRPSLPRAGRAGRPTFGSASLPPAKQQTLREVFTPTRPQRSARRLVGRQPELIRIFRAIAVDRAHVVLYGERGRGKTSLVNLVAAAARSSGYMVGRFACSFDSTFDDIVRGLACDLPASFLAVPAITDGAGEGCEAGLPIGKLQPRDIAALPGRLTGRHLLLIIDEFDRVEDPATRTRFADTIKLVSDRGAAVSFVIVGVSDSLEELLGRHPSIQRNILGMPLPLLTDAEIEEILGEGGREANIEFPRPMRAVIVSLARGMPYIAQLLGLHAAAEAAARGATVIGNQDLYAAIKRAVDEADPRVTVLYERLTKRGRDAAMRDALYGIAAGEQDKFARFVVNDQGGVLRAAGFRISQAQWEQILELGAVRPCLSAGPGAYTFADPMLPHYVLMREALEG
ncbi:MAG: ATP-binding protein [Acetobacteraceae bacterium]|nr:ATP-binding protein [Acetobacteraceae bacterium]MBV8589787.1 ATP-binding protein [Acetobacteraceae bacterium]